MYNFDNDKAKSVYVKWSPVQAVHRDLSTEIFKIIKYYQASEQLFKRIYPTRYKAFRAGGVIYYTKWKMAV